MATYQDFKHDLMVPSNREYWGFIQSIDRFVPAENVKIFYPKNLYSGNPDLTLILFTERDIWIAEQSDQSVKITVHKNIQIENVTRQIHIRSRLSGTQLILSLRSGETLKFNSKDDAPNEDWIENFSGYIDDIFDLVIKAP